MKKPIEMTLTLGDVTLRLNSLGEVWARRDGTPGEDVMRLVMSEENFAGLVELLSEEEGISSGAAFDQMAEEAVTWEYLSVWGVPVAEVQALVAKLRSA